MNNLFIQQFEQVNWAIPEKKTGGIENIVPRGEAKKQLAQFPGLE